MLAAIRNTGCLGAAYSLWSPAVVTVSQSCMIALQVLKLFKAADKYDVAGLVKECVQIFKKITRAADVAPLLQVR